MKVALFGATGATGQWVVQKGLAAGYELVVLARNPAKITIQHERLQIHRGDAEDAAAVNQTVAGTDAVISLLAPNLKAIEHILGAMKSHQVQRLIIVAGAGVPQPGDTPTAIHHFISGLVKLISRRVYDAAVDYVATVQASDRKWTVIRAPRLVDQPATGLFYVGPVSKEMGLTLSRADLADFLLREVSENAHLYRAPVVANSKSKQ